MNKQLIQYLIENKYLIPTYPGSRICGAKIGYQVPTIYRHALLARDMIQSGKYYEIIDDSIVPLDYTKSSRAKEFGIPTTY